MFQKKIKTHRILKRLILAGGLSLVLAGCGNQTQIQEESTMVSEQAPTEEQQDGGNQIQIQEESTMVSEQAPTEEQQDGGNQTQIQEESTMVSEQAPTEELVAGFDEEFVLKPGETLNIGREGITIAMNWIDWNEGGTTFGYSLTIDEKEVIGLGFVGTEIGNQVHQDEFTENRVCCISAEEDKSVTLLVTSGTIIPEALVLSGKASDEYVTTKPEYVENDNIILFMGEGVKVYGNTMELIEKIIHIAEKESGLYMENDTPFSKLRGNETDWIYGQDVFPGVDVNNDKFHIYVADNSVSPSAYGHGLIINPEDLEIAEGNGEVILHEVLHCLQMHNGLQMDKIMDEGYATYMTGRICDKDEEMNFNFDATMNYSGYDRKITKDNAEEIFGSSIDDKWECYLYGFRFVTYLFEAYGDTIFNDILKDVSPKDIQNYPQISSQELIQYIKRNTADTVFEDFAVWLENNESRFISE